jgi:hypothetical protein
MKLREIISSLDLAIHNEGAHLDDEVSGGYSGDLLSDVIASGRKGAIWITIQVHENIIAVATLKDLAAIILAKNSKPLEETLENARSEEVTLLGSPLNAFQLSQELGRFGVSGAQ